MSSLGEDGGQEAIETEIPLPDRRQEPEEMEALVASEDVEILWQRPTRGDDVGGGGGINRSSSSQVTLSPAVGAPVMVQLSADLPNWVSAKFLINVVDEPGTDDDEAPTEDKVEVELEDGHVQELPTDRVAFQPRTDSILELGMFVLEALVASEDVEILWQRPTRGDDVGGGGGINRSSSSQVTLSPAVGAPVMVQLSADLPNWVSAKFLINVVDEPGTDDDEAPTEVSIHCPVTQFAIPERRECMRTCQCLVFGDDDSWELAFYAQPSELWVMLAKPGGGHHRHHYGSSTSALSLQQVHARRAYMHQGPERILLNLRVDEEVDVIWGPRQLYRAIVEHVDAGLARLNVVDAKQQITIWRGSKLLWPVCQAYAERRRKAEVSQGDLISSNASSTIGEKKENRQNLGTKTSTKNKETARKAGTKRPRLCPGNDVEKTLGKLQTKDDVKEEKNAFNANSLISKVLFGVDPMKEGVLVRRIFRPVETPRRVQHTGRGATFSANSGPCRLNCTNIIKNNSAKLMELMGILRHKCQLGLFQIPAVFGYEREVRKCSKPLPRRRGVNGAAALVETVTYVAPCGKRLTSLEQIMDHLLQVQSPLSVDMFCLQPNVRTDVEFLATEFLEAAICDTDAAKEQEDYESQLAFYDPCDSHKVKRVLKPPHLDVSCGKEVLAIHYTDPFKTGGEPKLREYVVNMRSGSVEWDYLCEFRSSCTCTDGCLNAETCDCQRLTKDLANGEEGLYKYRRLFCKVQTGVFECNSGCSCRDVPWLCGNRVVQQPVSVKMELFLTDPRQASKGWGVRALHDLPCGTFICSYTGELLLSQQADEEGQQFTDHYLMDLDYASIAERTKPGYEENAAPMSPMPETETEDPENSKCDGKNEAGEAKPVYRSLSEYLGSSYVIDCNAYGNIGKFFNHSCEPNMFAQSIFIETQDPRLHAIALFAARDVVAGEELTWDYNYLPAADCVGPETDLSQLRFMYCNCGAPGCHKKSTVHIGPSWDFSSAVCVGNFWKDMDEGMSCRGDPVPGEEVLVNLEPEDKDSCIDTEQRWQRATFVSHERDKGSGVFRVTVIADKAKIREEMRLVPANRLAVKTVMACVGDLLLIPAVSLENRESLQFQRFRIGWVAEEANENNGNRWLVLTSNVDEPALYLHPSSEDSSIWRLSATTPQVLGQLSSLLSSQLKLAKTESLGNDEKKCYNEQKYEEASMLPGQPVHVAWEPGAPMELARVDQKDASLVLLVALTLDSDGSERKKWLWCESVQLLSVRRRLAKRRVETLLQTSLPPSVDNSSAIFDYVFPPMTSSTAPTTTDEMIDDSDESLLSVGGVLVEALRPRRARFWLPCCGMWTKKQRGTEINYREACRAFAVMRRRHQPGLLDYPGMLGYRREVSSKSGSVVYISPCHCRRRLRNLAQVQRHLMGSPLPLSVDMFCFSVHVVSGVEFLAYEYVMTSVPAAGLPDIRLQLQQHRHQQRGCSRLTWMHLDDSDDDGDDDETMDDENTNFRHAGPWVVTKLRETDVSRGQEVLPIHCLDQTSTPGMMDTEYIVVPVVTNYVPLPFDKRTCCSCVDGCEDVRMSPAYCPAGPKRCIRGVHVPQVALPTTVVGDSRVLLQVVRNNPIMVKMELFRKCGDQVGVRVLQDTPKGTFLCNAAGDLAMIPLNEITTNSASVNVLAQTVVTEISDMSIRGRIPIKAFFTSEYINAGEEIFRATE
ncbi:unnamed protein product [Notodromas monacha]|uniref:SET domain-containing protein n=1 Tax=Notodromas monacha TaxID=399045 RepID=A0A7R9GA06_9CRUS|nr:unnamed protein product [Notodromas monacha]CAG0914813.1 unnamed protein product [Notodromas monacha]